MKITIWESDGKKRVIRLPNWLAINGKTLRFIAKTDGTTAVHCDIVDGDRPCEVHVEESGETIDVTLQPTENKTNVVTTDNDVQVAQTQLPKVPRETVRNIRNVIKQMRKIHKDWVFVDVQDADGERVVIEL